MVEVASGNDVGDVGDGYDKGDSGGDDHDCDSIECHKQRLTLFEANTNRCVKMVY